MEKFFKPIIHYSLFIIIFLFPLFFLPFTQEFFATGKLYLLAFAALFLFLISNIQYLISKKISWISLPFDTPVILFVLTLGLSILIASPNKVQALLNPNFGLVGIVSLAVLYYYLSRHLISINLNQSQLISTNLNKSLSISFLLLSLLTIIFFFQPFKNVNLPPSLQFLKNPAFTPLGSQLDLAIFLGFAVVYSLSHVMVRQAHHDNNTDVLSSHKDNKSVGVTLSLTKGDTKTVIFNFSLLTFNLLALSLTLYSLFKPISTNLNQSQPISILLPPFRLSWYAAVEVLKNPINALFGVGVDNFSSVFTRVKDLAYNQSPLWQINSFALSRSTLLHIFTETGIFGLTAFSLLLFAVAKALLLDNRNHLDNGRVKMVPQALFGYLLLILIFFPPSLITFFLFVLTLSQLSTINYQISNFESKTFDFFSLIPLYFGVVIISFAFIAGAGYLLGRGYAAEVFFKQSLDGFARNDAKQVYDNMRQAIILNPYIERFRLNFSQVNLMIANNIAAKVNQPQGKDQKPYQLTEQDRQTIAQGIQAAIAEAKAAVALNPQKAGNWENLAVIYRNIINTAQGADVWTISAYQRAIVADPQNPIYRLNLGGVYYSLSNYEEAVKLFEQAVALKPDWPNAHYNLAWTDYQRQNYQRAVSEMQNVLNLLNPQKDKTDYERAQKDLEEFKKKLPESSAEATPSGQKPSQLTLPTPPAATLEPKIRLPREASPEAK